MVAASVERPGNGLKGGRAEDRTLCSVWVTYCNFRQRRLQRRQATQRTGFSHGSIYNSAGIAERKHAAKGKKLQLGPATSAVLPCIVLSIASPLGQSLGTSSLLALSPFFLHDAFSFGFVTRFRLASLNTRRVHHNASPFRCPFWLLWDNLQ